MDAWLTLTEGKCVILLCFAPSWVRWSVVGIAGGKEGLCKLCPTTVGCSSGMGCRQPPISAALPAAPHLSFNHNVWFCRVLSKPGSCLETGRVRYGCTQNQEFQISAESDRGESHFPLNRWERLLPWLWYACTCARGTSKTALALFSPGVPVRVWATGA